MASFLLTRSNLPSLYSSPIFSSNTLESKRLSRKNTFRNSMCGRTWSYTSKLGIKSAHTSSNERTYSSLNLVHTHVTFYYSGNLFGSKRVFQCSNLGHAQIRFYRSGPCRNAIANSANVLLMVQGDQGGFVWNVFFVILGCWVIGTLCFGNLETVPYTKRMHLVYRTEKLGHWLSNELFKDIKTEHKSKILPAQNPVTKRIFAISKNILKALHKDLELDGGSMKLSYANANDPPKEKLNLEEKPLQSRKNDIKKGKHHLRGMHWEVMVIDETNTVNAFCIPNGKIVIFTGLLKVCKTDDEIATVIGHEVAHVLARHLSEQLVTTLAALAVSLLFSMAFSLEDTEFITKLKDEALKYLIAYPVSRRMEAEADHIGLMLMASAGYDPQKAPEVYKKLNSDKIDFLSTHPTGEKRSEMLSRRETMQEAVAVYNQRKFGNKVL